MNSATLKPPSIGARIGRTTTSVVLSIVAVCLGIALGALAAVLGLNISLPLGLIAGAVTLFASVWVLTALAHKIWPSSKSTRPRLARRKAPYVVAGAALAIAGVAAGATVLAPVEGEENPVAAIEPRYWDLDTGSRVAYWKFDATTASTSDVPIIFVHGGPGGSNQAHDFEFFPELAATGHDVYLYDQPGAGFSPNLALDDYTLERMVEDLDAIRAETGSEKAIVIGQSAGGFVIEAYAAEHPEHVEKAILTAPGGYLTSPEITAASAEEEKKREELGLNVDAGDIGNMNEKVTPRILTTIMLHSFGFSAAAENLTSQDDVKRWSAVALGDNTGLNFHANLMLAKDFGVHAEDTLEKLKELDVPTMMLKPQFDYVLWSVQYPYVEANRDMQVVYIEDAEHNAWVKQPKAARDAIATFIEGGTQDVYTGSESPAITLGSR